MKKNIVYTILLTACIKPNSSDILTVSDPVVRARQYEEALQWYIENTDINIVLCENSGVDLSGKFANHKDRVEFLTFVDPPEIEDKGKGYKEANIMKYAHAYSKFISRSDLIIKITGRLVVLNIQQIIDFNNLRYSHNRAIPFCSAEVCLRNRAKVCDSQAFIYNESFMSLLRPRFEDIRLDVYFEAILFRTMFSSREEKDHICFIFPPPRLRGVSGTWGNNLELSNARYYRTIALVLIKYVLVLLTRHHRS